MNQLNKEYLEALLKETRNEEISALRKHMGHKITSIRKDFKESKESLIDDDLKLKFKEAKERLDWYEEVHLRR